MVETSGPVARVLAATLALLIVGASPALGDEETADDTQPRTERPTTLDRPIGVKP